MADTTAPQAPVAGADPRADGWRVLAATCIAFASSARSPHKGALADAAAALRDAAEAVTEAQEHEAEAARQANTWEEMYNAAAARAAEAEAALRTIVPVGACPYRHCGDGTKGCRRPECVTIESLRAPRPSGGPAAGEEGPSGFDVGPVAYTNADALRDGLAARERAREREGAARASDDTAPTTREEVANG